MSAADHVRLGVGFSRQAALERDPRERLYHLHRARESLVLALQEKDGLSEPEAESVQLHLASVMQKMGESPDALTGLIAASLPRPERLPRPEPVTPVAERDTASRTGSSGSEAGLSEQSGSQERIKEVERVHEQIRELHVLVEKETEARASAMTMINTLTKQVSDLQSANDQLEGKVHDLEGRRRAVSRGGQSRQGPTVRGKGVPRDDRRQDDELVPAPSARLSGFVIEPNPFAPFMPESRQRVEPTPAHRPELTVHILNGVSVEEQAQFTLPVDAAAWDLLRTLDETCQRYIGLPISRLQYVATVFKGGQRRHERRPVDEAMVREVTLKLEAQARDIDAGKFVLVLCTIPSPPVQEMEVCNVRLRAISPCHVAFDGQRKLTISTTPLSKEATYQVALTNQWDCGKTFLAMAHCLPDARGVEFALPFSMQMPTSAGLYDVHIIIDNTYRTENRRALTVSSGDDESDSSEGSR